MFRWDKHPLVGVRSEDAGNCPQSLATSNPLGQPADGYSLLEDALRNRTIPSLDGLRAIFVGVVLLGHLGVPYAPASHGVMGFFVLSGFLITWLLLEEHNTSGSVSLRRFYMRRALRLLPAFYTFWFIYVGLVFAVKHEFPLAQYVSAFFYYSNYYEAIVRPAHMAMQHTWSLAVEEQFYLLWPLVMLILLKRGRRLIPALILFIAASAVYRAVLVAVGVSHEWLYDAFDSRASQLATGCLAAVIVRDGRFSKSLAGLTTRSWYSLISFGVLCASIAVGEVLEYRGSKVYEFLVGFTIDPLLIAVWLCQTVALHNSPLWNWLNSRPFRYVGGKLSYSLYLYHWIVNWGVMRIGVNLVVQAFLATGTAIGISACSYHLIERRFLAWKQHFAAVPGKSLTPEVPNVRITVPVPGDVTGSVAIRPAEVSDT